MVNPIRLILMAFCLFQQASLYAAGCNSAPINPITDVSWQCIFPVSLAGMASFGGEGEEKASNPICVCDGGKRVGIKVSFWEPARIIDTVSSPWCMMPLGQELNIGKKGKLAGSLYRGRGTTKAFQQVHYYQYPVWQLLDLFTDIPCLSDSSFDVLMATELNPAWNNEALALIVNPEAVLFANPAAIAACMADSSMSLKGKPMSALFWCMGSWGNTYPLSGSITATDYVEANAALAARSVFLMGRTGLLKDTSPEGCGWQYTPIWRKNRYRLQEMRPVKTSSCQSIGKSGLLWTGQKQPLVGKDNFSWMLFRKVDCCVSY